MAEFSSYSEASKGDYTADAHFLMQNADQDTLRAKFEDLLEYYFGNIKSTSLTIATGDVLALNGTPQEIVAAAGAGILIEPIAAFYNLDFNSAAYATNTTLQVKCTGADVACLESNTLAGSVTRYVKFNSIPTPSAAQTQMLTNAAMNVSVKNGDPVTGDSDIEVFLFYREVEV